jgi:hypothetical protein
MTAGYDFVKTPEAFSKIFEASVGVEAQVSAPVVVHGLTQGGKHNLPAVLADYSAKVAKLLTEPVACPYCSAKGDLDCPTCHNVRTVICPKCSGKLRFTCTRCNGGGELVCPTVAAPSRNCAATAAGPAIWSRCTVCRRTP